MRAKKASSSSRARRTISDYDTADTSVIIDPSKQLRLEDLDLKLPEVPPTQVISIRLPSALLNEIRAIGSERDIPYQGLIKMFLSECVSKYRKKSVA